jgi:hypothetical protein
MHGFESIVVIGLFVGMQILGIVSACAARLCEGTPREILGQRFFLLVMLLMGLATPASLAIGPDYWMVCSATLAFMVLTVVYNFHGGSESATW